MTHTPEPWGCENDVVMNKDGRTIAHVMTSAYDGRLNTAIDALRICACVNACAGLDPVVLSAWNLQGATVKQQMAEAQQSVIELQEQRDELLAALRDCVAVMDRDLNGLAVIQPELRIARSAIAKVEAAK